ncbi:carbohydrate kinase [Sphingomonas sp. So64.6b]|uniref:FGGY-family carbohydrate kinase n=1 Tax=Sphingomonas sp. So64.6b TaxID=2997354 RepID=UPI0016008A74|nr:carbohydrate kinase [Sphingomonas sp. So64.6b]QNA86146.1 carbohydrate kinase [Sphingomonas sp. So64.6b]
MSKLTLWDGGTLLERRTRANEIVAGPHYTALDSDGIEAWMVTVLRDFAAFGRICAIVPVAHGAAIAVLRDGRLAVPPIDYEQNLPAERRALYDAGRDPFAATGSPPLPAGLNIGAQLDLLDDLYPALLTRGATILPWAQYWAWLLSGVPVSEVTSLGCHSDLWRPADERPSQLAERRGWAALFAPIARAGDVVGAISPAMAARTGLPGDVRIHAGLHDSNAALHAARAFAEIGDHEATILSTGTWFVAMRSPGAEAVVDIADLPEARDCLVNVDVRGRMVPSSRFMGGREIELLSGIDTRRVDIKPDQPALVAAVQDVVAAGAMALPSMMPGVGPFPAGEGDWIAEPDDPYAVRAAACLYAALVADAALDLIGSRDRLLIEGRFAEAQVFVRALASLRPDTAVYTGAAHNDVSYGALRLVDATLAPPSALDRVMPLEVDLTGYRDLWRKRIAGLAVAA